MLFALLYACGTAPEPSPRIASPALASPPEPPPAEVAPRILADLHLDSPTQLVRRQVGLDASALESSVPKMQAGGTNLAVQVLWPERKGDWAAMVEAQLRAVEAEDQRLDTVTLVRTPAEARAAVGAGQIALLIALEGAHGIETTGIAGLRALHARGLTMLGLTWSMSNRFAGSSGDGGAGLTTAGRELVAEANRLGVMLDVSHASDATTLEVCALSSAPVIASHSNADGVREHARNLSDAAIRCIAEGGGVIGLNLHGDFLGPNPTVATVADHADYLRNVGGVGVVALGSDFDGIIRPPDDLPDAASLPRLWQELTRRGWSDADLRKVQGDNFMRAWDAAVAQAATSR